MAVILKSNVDPSRPMSKEKFMGQRGNKTTTMAGQMTKIPGFKINLLRSISKYLLIYIYIYNMYLYIQLLLLI